MCVYISVCICICIYIYIYAHSTFYECMRPRSAAVGHCDFRGAALRDGAKDELGDCTSRDFRAG